ncbi:unnamed protein product [Toxocara canis]|uniref:Rbsn domain-containing protein n=1 Tax=Toxocara canis TaxID=6265 RepID=A0A183TXJ4_TOXCA|nr:unnamed protein product [Toxocara canis]
MPDKSVILNDEQHKTDCQSYSLSLTNAFPFGETGIDPDKVNYRGNLDKMLKETKAQRDAEIEMALLQSEMEELTQSDSLNARPQQHVKINVDRCDVYDTDNVRTLDKSWK